MGAGRKALRTGRKAQGAIGATYCKLTAVYCIVYNDLVATKILVQSYMDWKLWKALRAKRYSIPKRWAIALTYRELQEITVQVRSHWLQEATRSLEL